MEYTISVSSFKSRRIMETRQDFAKNLINSLQVAADNLALADTNKDSATLTELQTRQQIFTIGCPSPTG